MAKRRGRVNKLSNVSIDEVSLVDRGANQHALVAIAKRDELSKMDPGSSDVHVPGAKKVMDNRGLCKRHGKSNCSLCEVGVAKGGKKLGNDKTEVETHAGNDPAEVTAHPNAEEGDAGPGGSIGGVETEEGESLPAGNGKKKAVAKFWTELLADDVSKHFPGSGAANPLQNPNPGAMGGGQPPVMQTPAAAGPAMGQPQMPGGMPGQVPGMPGQMGQQPQAQMPQLPPEVIEYIQQLEALVDQLQGGDEDGGGEDTDSSNSSSEPKSGDKNNPFGKSEEYSMDSTFLTELAKSLDSEDQREAISKAQEAVSKAEARAAEAERIAKAERDLRLTREFVAKAESYALPVRADELGPVLKRLAETVSDEDYAVIEKCLEAASSAEASNPFFQEIGKRGLGSNGDVLAEVETAASELVAKGLTAAEAQAKVLEMHPELYDQYIAGRRK